MPGVRTQPVFNTPIVMPRAAASRALPSLPTGVQTGGCGSWYGRGQTLTERYWKCVPSQLNGPSCEVIAFRIKSCASQKRSTRSAGFVLAGEISNGTPLTKPISSRPREITSIVAYSSATRIGSLRLPIGMPSAKQAHFFGFARQDRHRDRADRIGTGRSGVVLVGHDVDAELVAQRPLVEIAVVEISADFRVVEARRDRHAVGVGRDAARPGGRPSR